MKRVCLRALVIAVGAASCTSYAGAGDGDDPAEGRRLFTKVAVPPCGLCHTLKDAGTNAEIGPSLDELRPDAERVAKALRAGTGVMPAYTALSEKDIEALARYVARYSGAR
jgi:mono/diheme cytochrome c family protein